MTRRSHLLGILLVVLLSAHALAAPDDTAMAKPNPAIKPGLRKGPHRVQSSKKRPVHRAAVQQQPTPERYKEIQQALASKGYFNDPIDGNWSQGWVEALKRFQHDQNLPEDGKIGSLSLIALGLGPKRVVLAKDGEENPVPATGPETRDPIQEP